MTACQSGWTRPGRSPGRVSIRRRCSVASEQITSTSTIAVPRRARGVAPGVARDRQRIDRIRDHLAAKAQIGDRQRIADHVAGRADLAGEHAGIAQGLLDRVDAQIGGTTLRGEGARQRGFADAGQAGECNQH
jgi:hypothetical protein